MTVGQRGERESEGYPTEPGQLSPNSSCLFLISSLASFQAKDREENSSQLRVIAEDGGKRTLRIPRETARTAILVNARTRRKNENLMPGISVIAFTGKRRERQKPGNKEQYASIP